MSVVETRLDNRERDWDNLRAERAHLPQWVQIGISLVGMLLGAVAAWYAAGLVG